jgi:hypothetical protein
LLQQHVSDPTDEAQTSGTITVGLAQPIVVDEIFIEHSYAFISPNMSSAPRLIQAWGHQERWDTEGVLLGEFVYQKEHDETVHPRQTFPVGPGAGRTATASATTSAASSAAAAASAGSASSSGSAAAVSAAGSSGGGRGEAGGGGGGASSGNGLRVNAVRLEVMANHGSHDYTCVYGIGVHGTPQEQEDDEEDKL